MRTWAKIAGMLLVLVMLTSCHGTGTIPGDGAEDIQTTFDVEWDPNTTFVDEDQLNLVKDADTENHVYTFDAAGVQQSGLDLSVGRVLVIHGVALRTISSVQQVGPNLVLETEYAALTDAITDGTIEWDYRPRFTPESVTEASADVQRLRPMQGAVLPQKQFTYGGYTYDVDIEALGDKVKFKFSVEKSLAGPAGAKLIAEGEVQRFRSQGRVSIKDKKVEEFANKLDKMQGEATLTVVVAGSGQDFINYKPDFTLIKLPFMVGPIYMELAIKVQFVIQASVPVEGSANLKIKLTYDSDLGFRLTGAEPEVDGGLRSLGSTDKKTEVGAVMAIGANFGVGFPRVELSIYDSLTGWIQPAFLLGGSFTFTPPCVEVKASFIGAAGAEVGTKIFGKDFKYTIWNKTLINEEKVLFRSAECPDAASLGLTAPGAIELLTGVEQPNVLYHLEP